MFLLGDYVRGGNLPAEIPPTQSWSVEPSISAVVVLPEGMHTLCQFLP